MMLYLYIYNRYNDSTRCSALVNGSENSPESGRCMAFYLALFLKPNYSKEHFSFSFLPTLVLKQKSVSGL